MANLWRLEDPAHPDVGGVLAEFPSGRRLQASWRHAERVDALATAKRVAAHLLDTLMRDGLADDADRTNWPSVVAAVQAIVMQWDAKRQTVDNQPANG